MNDFCCLKTGSGLTLEGTLRLTLEGRQGGGVAWPDSIIAAFFEEKSGKRRNIKLK